MRHRDASRASRPWCPLERKEYGAHGGRGEYDRRADEWEGLGFGQETAREDRGGDPGSVGAWKELSASVRRSCREGLDRPTFGSKPPRTPPLYLLAMSMHDDKSIQFSFPLSQRLLAVRLAVNVSGVIPSGMAHREPHFQLPWRSISPQVRTATLTQDRIHRHGGIRQHARRDHLGPLGRRLTKGERHARRQDRGQCQAFPAS